MAAPEPEPQASSISARISSLLSSTRSSTSTTSTSRTTSTTSSRSTSTSSSSITRTTSSSSYTSTSRTTGSTATATVTRTPAPTPTLSTGRLVAIIIGALLALAIIAGLVLFLVMSRRKKRAMPVNTPSFPGTNNQNNNNSGFPPNTSYGGAFGTGRNSAYQPIPNPHGAFHHQQMPHEPTQQPYDPVKYPPLQQQPQQGLAGAHFDPVKYPPQPQGPVGPPPPPVFEHPGAIEMEAQPMGRKKTEVFEVDGGSAPVKR
ncbi:MAG: hypothetical protein M1814_004985 [Vezdaea aestivalis]|nr:MAG: hypothetical protein M1814_004985 [Vezdaea aestivalis]